uniref:Uncharacterized protein n=1 Tax=Trichuris muris TaxID=70415 RepID=A0A5S6QAC4_TRIMR
MGIFPGVDFEVFVRMDDELVTCNEPDAESIFQAALSEVREMHESADDLEEEMDSDGEVEKTLTADDVRHSLHQVKLFVAEECPDMLNATVNADFAFTTYVCSKKAMQTTLTLSLDVQRPRH